MLITDPQLYIDKWTDLGGYYLCPKDDLGQRHGPLVGYAGRYREGERELQYVGDGYYNFAVIESAPNPNLLTNFAVGLAAKIQNELPDQSIDWVAGMAMGGVFLAGELARHLRCRRTFVEKKTTKLATVTSREEFVLVLNRHDFPAGSNGLIIEDVTNNFSTSEQAQIAFHEKCVNLLAIATALNRSTLTTFSGTLEALPVISLIHRPTPEYRQDDPFVIEDVQAGNVIWKPKEQWDQLMLAQRNFHTKDETGC